MKKIFLILALLCVSLQALQAQTYQFESASGGSTFYWSLTGQAQKTDSLRVIQGTNMTITQSGNTITFNGAAGAGSTANVRANTGWTSDGTTTQDTLATIYRLDKANIRFMVVDADGDTLWLWPQSLHPFVLKDGTSRLSGIDSTGRGYFGGNATTTGQTNRALLNVVGISDTLLAIIGDGNRAPGDSTLLIHASGNVQSQGRAGFGAATSGQASRAYLNVLRRAGTDTMFLVIADGNGVPGDSTVVITSAGNVGIGTATPMNRLHVRHPSDAADEYSGLRIAPSEGGTGYASYHRVIGFRNGGLWFGGSGNGGNYFVTNIWFNNVGAFLGISDGGTDPMSNIVASFRGTRRVAFAPGDSASRRLQGVFTVRPHRTIASDTMIVFRNDANATLDSTLLVHANADLQSASRAGFGVATVGQARRAILNVIGSADTILAAIGDVNKAPGDSTAIIFADGSHQFGVTAGGTNAFSGTAEHDTVTVAGASVNDIYTVTIKGAAAPAAADLFAVEALATGFAVHRSAAGTSGLEYYWRRERR